MTSWSVAGSSTTSAAQRPKPALAFTAEALRNHLAQRLQDLRMRRGLSQAELGDHAHVGERQVGKLERAEGGGSLETWHKLADALDVPLEELFRPAPPDGPGLEVREQPGRYVPVPAHRRQASSQELDALLLTARQLDSKSIRALAVFARRLAAKPAG